MFNPYFGVSLRPSFGFGERSDEKRSSLKYSWIGGKEGPPAGVQEGEKAFQLHGRSQKGWVIYVFQILSNVPLCPNEANVQMTSPVRGRGGCVISMVQMMTDRGNGRHNSKNGEVVLCT